jgi:predicted MFS family arabinose efflux permease
MGLAVLGFQQAGAWGWGDVRTCACIVLGLAVLAWFAVFETRVETPLIKLRIFRDRAFLADNGVLFFSMIAFVPAFFFASVYSQAALGYDANRAGLYLLMIFAGFAPAAQLGGRMLDRRGAKRPMVLGSALGCVGFALWASKLDHLSLGAQWPYIVMAGAGIGLLLGPASTDAVNRSIDASYGEVTGITQTVRNFGSTIGLAVLATILMSVLTHRLTSSLESVGLDEGAARSLAHDIARGNGPDATSAPPALRDRIDLLIAHDFATATSWVLYGLAIALALTFLIAVRHPGGRVEDTTR